MSDKTNEEVVKRILWVHRKLLDVTTDLADEQFCRRPSLTAPPIGWHLWHISRWADRTQAALPRPDDADDAVRDPNHGIWEQEHLAAQWDLDPTSLGTLESGLGMDHDAAAQLPRQVGQEQLLDYAAQAFAALDAVVEQLTSEEIDAEMESPAQFAVVDGEIIRAPGQRTTVAGTMLYHVSHGNRHLGMIEALRGLLDQDGTASI